MHTGIPDHKKLSQQTMLAKIADVLEHGQADDPPAYTLILGAGASFGVVPTAKEMLGLPDPYTQQIHDKSIPLWLAQQKDPKNPTAIPKEADQRKALVATFWEQFRNANVREGRGPKIQLDADGLPCSESVAAAYQAVFDTACVGGLDTPERHRHYMRQVTLPEDGKTHLNATHFYLASLLSLQRRREAADLGASKKRMYTGRREFARTLFTTNFDPLLQTSLQLFQLLYYMTDRPELLPPDALQTDQHPAIHLFYAHGSVHRPYLANTEEQIQLLKQQNARDLAAYLGSHGVIVLGYSGWDDCLLEALNQTKTFANNLYWLARRGSALSASVCQFLGSHANAYCVEIDDGGHFMADLHARLCPGAPNSELLYNPIQPLRRQLGCVNLSGIRTGGQSERRSPADPGGAGPAALASDLPRDVDEIRRTVLHTLEDAERQFFKEGNPRSETDQKLDQADRCYANRDWAAALELYDQLLQPGSDLSTDTRALALVRRGFCFGQQGEHEKEIADYSAVLDLPDAPAELVAQARALRGACFGQQGEFEKAMADFSAVLDLPGAPAELVALARLLRGACFDDQGEVEKAMADCSAVLDLPGAPAELVADAHEFRTKLLKQIQRTEKRT